MASRKEGFALQCISFMCGGAFDGWREEGSFAGDSMLFV